MKEHIHWVDVAKGLGMFLVILGHTVKNNEILWWIYSFHMPLFFFLSGYLSEQNGRISNVKIFVIKKSKSLLLPFVFFRLLLVFYWLLVERYFRELDIGPIWFLLVLYFVDIIYAPILLKLKRKIFSILSLILSIILFYTLKSVTTDSLFFHQFIGWGLRILNGGIWFSLAFFCRKMYKRRKITKKWHVFVYLCCLTISLFAYKYNGNVSIYSNTINNIFLYLLLGICGIGAVLYSSKFLIKRHYFIEKIGFNSIIILAVHEPIKRIVIKLSEYFLWGQTQQNFWFALIISIVVLFSCVPIVYIFKYVKIHTGKLGATLLFFIK